MLQINEPHDTSQSNFNYSKKIKKNMRAITIQKIIK